MSGDYLWALQRVEAATRLQNWMFAVLGPTRPGSAIKIGAGIGTFSSRLLEAGATPLLLVEPEPVFVEELERRFGDDARVQIVPEALPDSPTLRERAGTARYAPCENVLDHIEDDVGALTVVVGALEPGGEVAVLLPAHPFLHGRLDVQFGHFRRFPRARLRSLISAAGAELTSLRTFNTLGVPGCWIAGRTHALDITAGSLRVYEALVRFWRPVEDALRPPVGLSLVAWDRRPR